MESQVISKIKQVYKSCSELPLYNFIKILVTNDFTWLIIEGEPSENELIEAWEIIFGEYLTIANEGKQNFILKCVKDVTYLENKIFIIQAVVNALSEVHNLELVKILQSYGFHYKYDPANQEQYLKELKLTISKSKSFVLQLNDRKKNLEELRAKEEEGSNTEADYDVLLVHLSKYMGYRVNAKEVSVSEFVAIVKEFKKAK